MNEVIAFKVMYTARCIVKILILCLFLDLIWIISDQKLLLLVIPHGDLKCPFAGRCLLHPLQPTSHMNYFGIGLVCLSRLISGTQSQRFLLASSISTNSNYQPFHFQLTYISRTCTLLVSLHVIYISGNVFFLIMALSVPQNCK